MLRRTDKVILLAGRVAVRGRAVGINIVLREGEAPLIVGQVPGKLRSEARRVCGGRVVAGGNVRVGRVVRVGMPLQRGVALVVLVLDGFGEVRIVGVEVLSHRVVALVVVILCEVWLILGVVVVFQSPGLIEVGGDGVGIHCGARRCRG